MSLLYPSLKTSHVGFPPSILALWALLPFPNLFVGLFKRSLVSHSLRDHLRSSSTTPHRTSTLRRPIFFIQTWITTWLVQPDSTQRGLDSWWRIYKFLRADHRSNNAQKSAGGACLFRGCTKSIHKELSTFCFVYARVCCVVALFVVWALCMWFMQVIFANLHLHIVDALHDKLSIITWLHPCIYSFITFLFL